MILVPKSHGALAEVPEFLATFHVTPTTAGQRVTS
jgi:hypothetical protein